MTVVWAVFLPRRHLGPGHLFIRTDKEGLKWLLTSAYSSSKLARWLWRLIEFYFYMVHVAVIRFDARRALSRSKIQRPEKTILRKELSILLFSETEEQQNVETEYSHADQFVIKNQANMFTVTVKIYNRRHSEMFSIGKTMSVHALRKYSLFGTLSSRLYLKQKMHWIESRK